MDATVNGHMSIREINCCGLPKVAQCHFGVAQSSSDEAVHGAAQRTTVAAARFVVLEVRCPRLTKKLVRQQPEKRDDIGLFYYLGSLGPLPPKHHVHGYRPARVVRQIDLFESEITRKLLEQARVGIEAGRYRICGALPLV